MRAVVPSTIQHQQWFSTGSSYPHCITINLGDENLQSKFTDFELSIFAPLLSLSFLTQIMDHMKVPISTYPFKLLFISSPPHFFSRYSLPQIHGSIYSSLCISRNLVLIILFGVINVFTPPTNGACHKLDRDSLLSFSQGIHSPFPLNWSSSVDCCTWEGVGCDKKQRVDRLWLPARGLTGTISLPIANLSSLSKLNLSHNWFSGPLQTGFFTSLYHLKIVDLSYNQLSGRLPPSDKLPITIQIVNLSSNYFNGTITSSLLETARKLEHFDVSKNSFSGTIPSFICKFSPSIKHVDFSNNDFIGPISHGFGECSELQILRAGFNELSGHLPDDIYNASKLQELYLPVNKLSGPINEAILNQINLKVLALYGNGLTGMIPQAIGKLYNLEQLLLHINQLNGTLPPSLMNCRRLITLNIRVNYLEGELSAFDFSRFRQLSIIDLGNNFFTGSLPASLFSCKTLTAIRLATNKLNGEILPDILELKSLSFLSVSNNSLTNITTAIKILSGCKNLSTLVLSKNFYNETLPGDESAILSDGFQSIQILAISYCRLKGQIPKWLAKMRKVEVFDLAENQITGTIPRWIGSLPRLFYIDLSQNFLSGHFPVELTELQMIAYQQPIDGTYLELPVFVQPNNGSNLQYNKLSHLPPGIYLRNNNISGAIPVEIGQLKFIHGLDLGNNSFSGSIPETISQLTNMERLYLFGNSLSGGIPASLKNLHFLSSFSVANNSLQGPIPEGGQFDTFPASSFEGNQGLCGRILRHPCTDQSKTTDRLTERDIPKEETINWTSFGISYGIFLVFTMLAVFKFSHCFP